METYTGSSFKGVYAVAVSGRCWHSVIAPHYHKGELERRSIGRLICGTNGISVCKMDSCAIQMGRDVRMYHVVYELTRSLSFLLKALILKTVKCILSVAHTHLKHLDNKTF
jgi:hypothetical protein